MAKRRRFDPPLAQQARELGISRQRMWAIVQRREGRCMLCGKPEGRSKGYCDPHADRKNAINRGDYVPAAEREDRIVETRETDRQDSRE
jgi:hypothetical protein